MRAVTDARRPLSHDEYGMLQWFAEQWPEDLSAVLAAIPRDAEAQVFVYDSDGYTTIEVAFCAAPAKLPGTSPYEGEAAWNVDGMSGEAMLFSSPEGVMLEVIWHDGWPGRFPQPHELQPNHTQRA